MPPRRYITTMGQFIQIIRHWGGAHVGISLGHKSCVHCPEKHGHSTDCSLSTGPPKKLLKCECAMGKQYQKARAWDNMSSKSLVWSQVIREFLKLRHQQDRHGLYESHLVLFQFSDRPETCTLVGLCAMWHLGNKNHYLILTELKYCYAKINKCLPLATGDD